MYNIGWAENFTGFEQDEQIDVHKFAVFYKEYIAGRDYEYKTNSPEIPSFVVSVKDNQLPHLMGLQHWNNLSVTQPDKQFEKLLKGEWDTDFLISSDISSWQEHHSRIEFMPYLFKLFAQVDCKIRIVHQGVKSGFLRRKMDMIFMKDHEKLIYVVELRGKPGEHVYFPSSVTIHRPNAKDLKVPHRIIKATEVIVKISRSHK